MIERLRRTIDWWVDHPSIDLIATLIVGIIAASVSPVHLPRAVEHGSFYQTLAGLSAALLSLGTLVVTLVFTVTPDDRLDRVLSLVGRRLQMLIQSSLTALVFTTGGFTALFIVEAEVPGRPLQAVTLSLATFAALRFGRIWWLLARILETLMTGKTTASDEAPAWTEPPVRSGSYKLPERQT